MKYVISLILVIGMLTQTTLAAEQGYVKIKDLQALEQRLSIATQEVQSIQSTFIQEKHLEYLDAVITSEGKFWFRKTNYLRWEYTEPFSYLILLNQSRFTIKDEDKKNEFDLNENPAFKKVIELISGAVQGSLLKENDFEVEAWENSSSYLVKLRPAEKKMKGILSRIEMVFDKKDLRISKVIMRENQQDYTVIQFIDRKINEAIPDSIFHLN